MKALSFSRFGGPEVLEWSELPDPVTAPGVALVRTHAIGLNFADVYRRQGRYHLEGSPPWIPGYEAAGEIVALHPLDAGSDLHIGQRVAFADSPFTNAELVAVKHAHLVALPADIAFDTAAAVLLQGLTAQYLLEDSHAVQPGECLLVHAGGGGVGQLLLQLARAKGAETIALASSADKRMAALAAGATHVVDAGDGWVERVHELSPSGVDVVYDSIGRTLAESLKLTRRGGTVVFYGMAGGDPELVNARMLMDRSLTLVGGDLWNVLTSAESRRSRAERLFAAIRAGLLRVHVVARFPLRDGAQGHALLEGRGLAGKILLIP